MARRNRWLRAALPVLLFAVATAGDCPSVGAPPLATGAPPKPVAGYWVGELYGVRLKLTLTDIGTRNPYFNFTEVGGSGWLVYGTAPAESVAVGIAGLNGGEPNPGPSFEIQRPNGTGGVYGKYGGRFQADGTLLGTFERTPTIEPSPWPWTATWPAGTTTAPLSLTRQ